MKEKRIYITGLFAAAFLVFAGGCGSSGISGGQEASDRMPADGRTEAAEGSEALPAESVEGDGETDMESTAYGRDMSRGIPVIPEELEYIPADYESPARQQGTLEKLEYQTYESFSYESHSQTLDKEAWVYLPYGYSKDEKYNVFYLSHGGWSNETTLMGTPDEPHALKHIIDHAIEDGKIKPLIIVLPTYNNTSESDSGDYSLAIKLTNNFHNELVNDLIPAVESKYSTYAESTDKEGLAASRDHRGFGGFSMGSVNTWRTFEYCLDYFRYFMPMSGSLTSDGEYMADIVRNSGHLVDDFFIFAASGTSDFAYSAFKAQIMSMGNDTDGVFTFADNEADGNLAFREREGYVHDGRAANEYTYNGLRFFWNSEETGQRQRGFINGNTLHSEVGDIHYSSYIPESYDGSEPYALFITLPGWEGLYFQGVGANMVEDFGTEAVKYNEKMIVLSTQLDDWGETSAEHVIALTEYFLENYNIDRSKVYLHGMSGGGETGSLVMGKRPGLYAAYLMTSSKWDGDLKVLADAETPVYMAIGEDDSYYGSAPLKEAYASLYALYEQKGLTEEEISRILVLDVKDQEYFSERGFRDQHAGGGAFAHDEAIMGWLFGN